MHGHGLHMMFLIKNLKLKNYVLNLLQKKIMTILKYNLKRLQKSMQIFLMKLKQKLRNQKNNRSKPENKYL
jgi:hypothetical protein